MDSHHAQEVRCGKEVSRRTIRPNSNHLPFGQAPDEPTSVQPIPRQGLRQEIRIRQSERCFPIDDRYAICIEASLNSVECGRVPESYEGGVGRGSATRTDP